MHYAAQARDADGGVGHARRFLGRRRGRLRAVAEPDGGGGVGSVPAVTARLFPRDTGRRHPWEPPRRLRWASGSSSSTRGRADSLLVELLGSLDRIPAGGKQARSPNDQRGGLPGIRFAPRFPSTLVHVSLPPAAWRSRSSRRRLHKSQSRQRFVIGVRRSRPNAFGRSFTPGGACRRLYSARSIIASARSTSSASNPSATSSSRERSSST